MDLIYKSDVIPPVEDVIRLYDAAGLPRPTQDKERIKKMFENSNLIVTAWDRQKLVGVSRSITDWAWSCYLADLAVDPEYHRSGIGKKLVDINRELLGEQVMILLLSVPTAMEYYPKIGFIREDRGFTILRTT